MIYEQWLIQEHAKPKLSKAVWDLLQSLSASLIHFTSALSENMSPQLSNGTSRY